MADFGDTSSYLKPSLPVSPLDIAAKVGGLQQQKLSIDQAKLDQANQGLTYLARAVTSLGPDASKDQYKAVGADMVKAGLVPENMLHIWNDKIDAAPDSATIFKQTLGAVADHQQQLNLQTGHNASLDNGATTFQGKVNPMTGGFTPATQSANQPPPTQPTVNNERTLPTGQPNPNYLQPGIVGPSGPSGVVPVPQARPRGLPVERPSLPTVSGPTGPTTQTGFDFKQRFAGEPIVTGAAPGVAGAMETIGKQSGIDYSTDLSRAKNLQTDLYPMNRVLDILKEEGPKAFGPGTEGLNTLKSAFVTWLPNVDQKTIEGVSNFEQAKKYLVQAARTAGNTGTNDQLAAAFEANPNVKMSGATIENVVKSNIALRKMQHAQTMLFGQQNLPPSEYSQWISKNQNSLDPRAFGFDMMDQKAKSKLVEQLAKDPKAYQKFETSLQFAHDADLIEKPARK